MFGEFCKNVGTELRFDFQICLTPKCPVFGKIILVWASIWHEYDIGIFPTAVCLVF
jgi:hypothetical protein